MLSVRCVRLKANSGLWRLIILFYIVEKQNNEQPVSKSHWQGETNFKECFIYATLNVRQSTDLEDLFLLWLIDFAGQTTVRDCIMDDWFIRFSAGFLEEL